MTSLRSKDETRLYYQLDHVESPVATALLIHGFGDHCHRYDRFAHFLNELGFTTLRFDYRGHGRSDGKRGHILSFSEYLDDVSAILSVMDKEISNDLPRVLFAHSNGSLIAAHALAKLPELSEWRAAVLSSPFFGLKVKVPAWKRILGKRLSSLMPSLQLPTDLDPQTMSHAEEVVSAYGTDPLVGKVASARWFTETLRAQSELPEVLSQIEIPILLQLAGADQVADSAHAESLFSSISSPEKQLRVYEGLFHEIWFEEQELRQPVFSDLIQFLSGRELVLKSISEGA